MSETVEAPRRWASSSRERLDGFVMVWLVAACVWVPVPVPGVNGMVVMLVFI